MMYLNTTCLKKQDSGFGTGHEYLAINHFYYRAVGHLNYSAIYVFEFKQFSIRELDDKAFVLKIHSVVTATAGTKP